MTGTTAADLLGEVLPLLGLDERYADAHLLIQPGNGLPARLPVNALACGSVAAAGLAGLALHGGSQVVVDPRQVAVSFRNDQLSSINGQPVVGFAPLSGFFTTADGWVRTHANYPHHHERLVGALDLPTSATRDDLAEVARGMRSQTLVNKVTAAGGLAVLVRTAQEWRDGTAAAPVDRLPLLAREQVGESARVPAPYRPKVLDLTRVIAGPVATQTLGFFGADVLRVDSPGLVEPEEIYALVSGEKRSTFLDLRTKSDRTSLDELLTSADVVVTGYRPEALTAYGLGSEDLAERHPHLVLASLSAWGASGPWGQRRGFDSLVQAATGIAMVESPDGERPGVLPGQVLDHATGYLLAAGVLAALRAREFAGGTWRVSAALARTAHWLLDHEPDAEPGQEVERPEDYQTLVRGEAGLLVTSRPAFSFDERDTFGQVGNRLGSDEPRWADDPRGAA
ncbi:MAG: CoA transferase [Actinomycetia bacterium]|nr:CoA transferase [Actinomycetes bacterium]